MRIRLFKMGKKGSVGECLHTRGVVRHDVQGAGQIVGLMKIPMFTLMGTLDVAEVGGGGLTGDGAFCDPGHSGRVVGATGDRSVGYVVVVRHKHNLAKEARVFEVAVGDDPFTVTGRHQLRFHLRGKRVPPDVREAVRAEVDTTHAGFGRIGGAHEAGILRDDLSQVCGPVAQAGRQGAKVVRWCRRLALIRTLPLVALLRAT